MNIPAEKTGLITGVSTLWDAINDPLVGTLIDARKFKPGNKRARLFLSEYLVKDAEGEQSTPIWAPSYLTISELFNSLTPIARAISR